jgi:hypothetical protein
MERDTYLSRIAAAEYLGVDPRTLDGWRLRGLGPRWRKYNGTMVRYAVSDLRAFADSCIVDAAHVDHALIQRGVNA